MQTHLKRAVTASSQREQAVSHRCWKTVKRKSPSLQAHLLVSEALPAGPLTIHRHAHFRVSKASASLFSSPETPALPIALSPPAEQRTGNQATGETGKIPGLDLLRDGLCFG